MKSFQDMSLPIELEKALKSLSFTTPTEIQAATIPIAATGADLIACAETGSGKTAAYAIPTIVSLLADKTKYALVLAPTRELAQQIADVYRDLTKFSDGLSVTALIGGADIQTQFRSLRKNPRILVATPGRLTDHLHRKSVNLTTTSILVLDEGDRMLDMGFAPQLDEILKFLPKKRQTSLFTATLPEKVRKLAEKYLSNPEQVNVGRISLPVATISQSIIEVTGKEKEDRLVDELNKREGSVIVFAKTKIKTDKLARVLKDYGFAVDLIHGDRSQGQRNKAIANFRNGKSRILVATDVAARGIDIPQVAHVINFDLPMMLEDYVHRIGRTARNGASGEAVSFVTPDESRHWNMIAKKYRIVGVELKNKSVRGGGRDFGDERRSRGPRSGGGGRSDRRSSFGGRSGEGSSERSGGEFRSEKRQGFRTADSADRSDDRRDFRRNDRGEGFKSESSSEGGPFASFKKKPFERRSEDGGSFRKFDKPKFEGERSERPKSDRQFDRPKFDKPKFDRPKFEDGEGESSERKFAKRPRSSEGFKSEGKKEWGFGEKREFKKDDSKPFGRKPFAGKKFGSDRSEDKSFGEKKFGEKKFGSSAFGEKRFGSAEGEAGSKRYSSKKAGEKKFGGFKKSSGSFAGGAKRSDRGGSKTFSKSF